MTYFAGPDVSLEKTAVCIIDESGEIVKEFRVANEPEVLITALRRFDLPLERIGLEACSLISWLHDGLCAEGLPAICIETRHANAPMKTQSLQDWAQQDRPPKACWFGAGNGRVCASGACKSPNAAVWPRRASPWRASAQARRDSPSHVARWDRVPLRQAARAGRRMT